MGGWVGGWVVGRLMDGPHRKEQEQVTNGGQERQREPRLNRRSKGEPGRDIEAGIMLHTQMGLATMSPPHLNAQWPQPASERHVRTLNNTV